MEYLLPWPPSVNQYWRAYKGRNILSAKARDWKKQAEQELQLQRPQFHEAPIYVEIDLYPPTRRKYDIDNRIKAILDLLVRCAIIEDDGNEHVVELTVRHVAISKENPRAKVKVIPCKGIRVALED